ncbi:MAG: hypothetical protein ABIV26_05320 [Candidatus Limnocylindrales bacterium]
MLQQPDTTRPTIVVRDGQLTAVTCASCGCRLREDASEGAWRHFGALGGRDARSHRTACIDLAHDASGQVSIPA